MSTAGSTPDLSRCVWCGAEPGTGAAMARHVNRDCSRTVPASVACASCGAVDATVLLGMQPGPDGAPWSLCARCWRGGW